MSKKPNKHMEVQVMDKISSIISSSKNKVDMSKERPVRAGAPTYGQPVSEATQTFKKIEKEQELMSPMAAVTSAKINSPDVQRHTGIIDKITLSFKGHSEREEPKVEQVIDLSTLETSGDTSVEVAPEEASEYQPLDLYA